MSDKERPQGDQNDDAPKASAETVGSDTPAAQTREGSDGSMTEPSPGKEPSPSEEPSPNEEPGDGREAESPAAVTSDADLQRRRERRQKTESVPVVVFDNVTKTYNVGEVDEFTAIQGVTFTVEDVPEKGEFVAVLGPSGCGKSTLLRLIAGLEPQHPPTSGELRVFGQSVVGPGADRGMVFQSYTSFDHRTVLQNITFGLECRGGLSKRDMQTLAKDWIQKVGLSVKHDAGKYPHELSGGMQQRVAIARTLILKPQIILMDEPFGALDPITRMHMQDTLVELWNEVEATVFFVTHSIEEAVYLGDRVYIFSNSPGRILKEVDVPPPNRPAMEMQRERAFQDVVFDLRDLIDRLEREQDERERAVEEAGLEED